MLCVFKELVTLSCRRFPSLVASGKAEWEPMVKGVECGPGPLLERPPPWPLTLQPELMGANVWSDSPTKYEGCRLALSTGIQSKNAGVRWDVAITICNSITLLED